MATPLVCSICASDPTAPLLRRVSDKPMHAVYYTHPSKIKQGYSSDQVIVHYRHTLMERGGKRWTWVLDGAGFDTDHIMDIKTGQGILDLLDAHQLALLDEVHIINPSLHLKILLRVISPFMNDTLLSKIKLREDRTRSILEFI